MVHFLSDVRGLWDDLMMFCGKSALYANGTIAS